MDLDGMTREALRVVAREHGFVGWGKLGAKALRTWLKRRLNHVSRKKDPVKEPVPVAPPPTTHITLEPPPRIRKPVCSLGDINSINRLIEQANRLGQLHKDEGAGQ